MAPIQYDELQKNCFKKANLFHNCYDYGTSILSCFNTIPFCGDFGLVEGHNRDQAVKGAFIVDAN
jgi:hypothetical protein